MKNILLVTMLLAANLFAEAQDKTIRKSFANIKTIELSTSSGNISLKKSGGAEVNLTVKYSYDEDAFKPEIEERNGRLVLKEEFTRGSHSAQPYFVFFVA